MTVSLDCDGIQGFAKQEAWRESFQFVNELKMKQVDRTPNVSDIARFP
jgi:hypothetical protein